MDNDVKNILKQIIANHGTLVYKKPSQLKSLLKDYCNGELKKEIMALMLVVEEGIVEEIIALKDKNIINRQVKFLCDSTPIGEEIAEWAVEAWYYSLGILDDVKAETKVDKHVNDAKVIVDKHVNDKSKIFQIKDLVFYEEDFIDDIDDYQDILDIIQELSSNLDYETIEIAGENGCCHKTKKNYLVEIIGYIDENDEFVTKAERDAMGVMALNKKFDLFVITVHKCTACNKWVISLLE